MNNYINLFQKEIDTNFIEINGIKFIANEEELIYRATTLETKEPDMIKWLNEYIKEDDILFDIGANVGVFSLYCAQKLGAKVFAFEPIHSTYHILKQKYIHKMA